MFLSYNGIEARDYHLIQFLEVVNAGHINTRLTKSVRRRFDSKTCSKWLNCLLIETYNNILARRIKINPTKPS